MCAFGIGRLTYNHSVENKQNNICGVAVEAHFGCAAKEMKSCSMYGIYGNGSARDFFIYFFIIIEAKRLKVRRVLLAVFISGFLPDHS